MSRSSASEIPYHRIKPLLWLLFLASLGLTLWSHAQQDQFPPPAFYDLERLVEPRQTRTLTAPFEITAEGIHYQITPQFDYELDGVVVSLHDSDSLWDIYHTKDWQDFINIRDLCVVWGKNVTSDAFRAMRYENTTWTCWISTDDSQAAQAFTWNQLSNNHLLSHVELVQRAIKSAQIGDQIYLRGQLASYAHGGGFQRGTSTTRDDTGNGACETIHVEDFQIVRKANAGWRLTYRLALGAMSVSVLGLLWILLFAPYRV